MNWYKKSQQSLFPFFSDLPPQKPFSIEKTEQYRKLIQRTPQILQNLLEQCNDREEIIKILKTYNFKFKIIKNVISVNINEQIYIIDDTLTLRNALDWIWTISDLHLDNYVDYPDFNKEFWNHPYTVYHATHSENLPDIKKYGLKMKKDSRGIENRYTGAAVFTSDNPDDIESYGNLIVKINTIEMKKDNYMPEVSQEKPIINANKREALAHKIGLKEFFVEIEHGISPTTIIFFGNIPPKYLEILK
jgi:hypothetical protein